MCGGSPCQSFTNTISTNTGFDGKSKLFFEYIRLLKECKPKYFLLENVQMKKEWENIITSYMGVKPVLINSDLFSAQSRPRLYWTNIPLGKLPESNSSVLIDILEQNPEPKYYYKELFEFHGYDKVVCATLHINGHDILKRVNSPYHKCQTLTAVCGGNQQKKVLEGRYMRVRKLTPLEYERLQTIPENFTKFLKTNYFLSIYQEIIGGKICVQNVKLTDVKQTSVINQPDFVINTTCDLSEQEQLTTEKLLIKQKNVFTKDATEFNRQNMDIVCYTINDLSDTELLLFQNENLKVNKNVNIVIKKLEEVVEQKVCVIDITKVGSDIMTLYLQIKKEMLLPQEDTMVKLIIKKDIESLWEICLDVNLLPLKECIILTLLNLIIQSKIYTYVKIKANIQLFINNLKLLQENYIKMELSDLIMENITLNSDSARYKMLGNGWTADLIAHIFLGLADSIISTS
jgi:DNA (cytosine-5)-methyltransferase 3A